MNDETLEITFLRHGRSAADDEGKFEGRYDSPLTATGQAQALARAQGWRQAGVTFDAVVCSTLQRAYSTARIVAECLELPLETNSDWMEVDIGGLCGQTYEEGERLFPTPDFRGPYDPICGGESEYELHARAGRAVQDVVRRGPGRWLVVGHGGIFNAALRSMLGVPLPINGHGSWFRFGDLGYARFQYDPSCHRWLMLELVRGITL